MKLILLMGLFIIAFSCNNSVDFYYGTWDLNEKNGVSTITLNEDNTISWEMNGFKMLQNAKYETVKKTPKQITIKTDENENCTLINIFKISKNQCIICNYKCWIDENMIDEVVVARKNKAPRKEIPFPDKEIIILPKEFNGNFFIVYKESDVNQSNEIVINDKGIGINQGEPDFKQLFNANRIFRIESQENHITIVNPNGYHNYLNTEIDSLLKDEEVIVIQQGFNQSGRADWNKVHGEKVKDNMNIEYFEVRRIRD